MPRYVDGFVLPIPKKNIASYLEMARLGARVWRDHVDGGDLMQGTLESNPCSRRCGGSLRTS